MTKTNLCDIHYFYSFWLLSFICNASKEKSSCCLCGHDLIFQAYCFVRFVLVSYWDCGCGPTLKKGSVAAKYLLCSLRFAHQCHKFIHLVENQKGQIQKENSSTRRTHCIAHIAALFENSTDVELSFHFCVWKGHLHTLPGWKNSFSC